MRRSLSLPSNVMHVPAPTALSMAPPTIGGARGGKQQRLSLTPIRTHAYTTCSSSRSSCLINFDGSPGGGGGGGGGDGVGLSLDPPPPVVSHSRSSSASDSSPSPGSPLNVLIKPRQRLLHLSPTWREEIDVARGQHIFICDKGSVDGMFFRVVQFDDTDLSDLSEAFSLPTSQGGGRTTCTTTDGGGGKTSDSSCTHPKLSVRRRKRRAGSRGRQKTNAGAAMPPEKMADALRRMIGSVFNKFGGQRVAPKNEATGPKTVGERMNLANWCAMERLKRTNHFSDADDEKGATTTDTDDEERAAFLHSMATSPEYMEY